MKFTEGVCLEFGFVRKITPRERGNLKILVKGLQRGPILVYFVSVQSRKEQKLMISRRGISLK